MLRLLRSCSKAPMRKQQAVFLLALLVSWVESSVSSGRVGALAFLLDIIAICACCVCFIVTCCSACKHDLHVLRSTSVRWFAEMLVRRVPCFLTIEKFAAGPRLQTSCHIACLSGRLAGSSELTSGRFALYGVWGGTGE